MRRLLLLALVGCGSEPVAGGAQIVLDIPNGVLDPKGYKTVEITLHEATGDVVRSVAVDADGRFDLGDMDPLKAVSIEAALRDDSGGVVGYGRTAAPGDLAAGATLTVPVRRPIVYISGPTYTLQGTIESWRTVPATYSDLSANAALDGSTVVADKPMFVVAAGPQLYAIDQAVVVATGAPMGGAAVREISTADHKEAGPLAGALTGTLLDAAGSDDGGTLVVGTSEKLFAVDTHPGVAAPVRQLAVGSFARVAIVASPDGTTGAVAIKNRVVTTGAACTPTAELWWIASTADEVIDAKMLAVGGFSDVAADGGRAWYVDACKGELGEATATGVRAVRGDLGPLGRPAALAVSNGQAWIGLERQTTKTLLLAVVPADSAETPPRTLWSEVQDQVVSATLLPGVERRLTGVSAAFTHLEIGAGGDYVAAVVAGAFHGVRVQPANFPEMDIVTEELRVFDATSGGSVQRYRSWCDGTFVTMSVNDINSWSCTTSTGQTGPQAGLDHRILSMTFQFGKK